MKINLKSYENYIGTKQRGNLFSLWINSKKKNNKANVSFASVIFAKIFFDIYAMPQMYKTLVQYCLAARYSITRTL